MNAQTSPGAVIGVMDSGVGGLSVLPEIHRLYPHIPTLYYADQAHLPYGPRSADEIHSFVLAICEEFILQGAHVIVLACHSASAASLYRLREHFPGYPFVGIEPAVKPAVEATQTGTIGVLTTRITANGALYRGVVERFAEPRGVRVLTQVAPEMVEIVEEGSQDRPESQQVIDRLVQPLTAEGADQIVLACTHYRFLWKEIAASAGEGVTLVDPAPGVARQVGRVWPKQASPASLPNRYLTSGDPAYFQQMIKRLIGLDTVAEKSLL